MPHARSGVGNDSRSARVGAVAKKSLLSTPAQATPFGVACQYTEGSARALTHLQLFKQVLCQLSQDALESGLPGIAFRMTRTLPGAILLPSARGGWSIAIR